VLESEGQTVNDIAQLGETESMMQWVTTKWAMSSNFVST